MFCKYVCVDVVLTSFQRYGGDVLVMVWKKWVEDQHHQQSWPPGRFLKAFLHRFVYFCRKYSLLKLYCVWRVAAAWMCSFCGSGTSTFPFTWRKQAPTPSPPTNHLPFALCLLTSSRQTPHTHTKAFLPFHCFANHTQTINIPIPQ